MFGITLIVSVMVGATIRLCFVQLQFSKRQMFDQLLALKTGGGQIPKQIHCAVPPPPPTPRCKPIMNLLNITFLTKEVCNSRKEMTRNIS